MLKRVLFVSALWLLPGRLMWAVEAGKVTGNENGLYGEAIQSTKSSIDREMIDLLYHDAVDAYNDQRYDEALELLDKIYSLDPNYADAAKLRASIRKSQESRQTESNQDTVRGFMRKGNDAAKSGENIIAINYWKQALALDPTYTPAKKKIQAINEALGRKEFESGYIHYRHAEMEDALDDWSNAIALDPTYKQRGLLLLMSKVQLQIEQDQTSRLASQGYDLYQQGNLEGALQTYEELNSLQPRNDEARRMAGKIKIQLGEAAFKAARSALASGSYSEAATQADKCILYGYEIVRAQKIKTEAQGAMHTASRPKSTKKVKETAVVRTSSAPAAATAAAPPPAAGEPQNPEEAMDHYRKGLAAMRTKDYRLAMQELDIAAGLDASNEHIYIARQRAQQEWAAATNGTSGASQ